MPSRPTVCFIAPFAAVFSFLVHAATPQAVPFTFSKQDEVLLEGSNLLEQKLRERALIYVDNDLTEYVTSLAAPMLPRADLPRVTWRFLVQRDSMPNAFAAPNGTIYVTSGLLSVLQTEDELKAILAHEIVHVRDRHSYLFSRRYRSNALVVNLGTIAMSVVSNYVPVPWGVTLQIMNSVIPDLVAASLFGYSRENERDADRDGFGMFAETQPDLAAFQQSFVRLGSEPDTPREPIFWNDHPKLTERVNAARAWRAARSDSAPAPDVLDSRKRRFLSIVERVKRHNVRLDIDNGRYRAALNHARELVEWSPTSSNLLVLALAYRELGPRPVERRLEQEDDDVSDQTGGRAALMRTRAGRAAWQKHSTEAEALYRRVQTIDPSNGAAYLGIGELFELDGKHRDAIQAYSHYLSISPDAANRRAILLRVDNLTRTLTRIVR